MSSDDNVYMAKLSEQASPSTRKLYEQIKPSLK